VRGRKSTNGSGLCVEVKSKGGLETRLGFSRPSCGGGDGYGQKCGGVKLVQKCWGSPEWVKRLRGLESGSKS